MKIFEPIDIGSVKLKNRLFRSATWLGAAGLAGKVTETLISRSVECSEGGPALFITGFAYIVPEGALLPAMIAVDDDTKIDGLTKLTDAVHADKSGVKIFCQIVHCGMWRLPFVRTSYEDTFAADETKDPFVKMGGTGETCPPASEEQILDVIGKWAAAAGRCKASGFDGIELHFGHGFGAAGWFSPLWNHRTDSANINCEDGVEGGVTHDDSVFLAEQLVEAGIDGLEISGGSPGAGGGKLEAARLAKAGKEGENGEGYFAGAAARVKAAVGGSGTGKVPIIGVGGWRTPAIMEKHAGGSCDAFGLSRPLINDPGIVNKWKNDPNHLTGCISCNKCLKGEGPVLCRKDE